MSYLRAIVALHLLSRKARILTTAIAIVVTAWPNSALYAAEQDRSVIGNWKLTAVLDSSEITALDDEDARKLVGQVLHIGADWIKLGGRVCNEPDFEVTRAETKDYFARRAHASADRLGLPNPVTAVHISCTYVYKKAAGRLVVHWKGFFFDAVAQK